MNRWTRNGLLALSTVATVYGMIYADVVLRARSAYLEGERYWRWSEHPEERQKYLDDQLVGEQWEVLNRLKKGKLSKEEYDREVMLLQFGHDQALQESTLKYAYTWYQTAVELFSPPDSQWVRLSRQKMPIAKERWIEELKAKHIPFESYMID